MGKLTIHGPCPFSIDDFRITRRIQKVCHGVLLTSLKRQQLVAPFGRGSVLGGNDAVWHVAGWKLAEISFAPRSFMCWTIASGKRLHHWNSQFLLEKVSGQMKYEVRFNGWSSFSLLNHHFADIRPIFRQSHISVIHMIEAKYYVICGWTAEQQVYEMWSLKPRNWHLYP